MRVNFSVEFEPCELDCLGDIKKDLTEIITRLDNIEEKLMLTQEEIDAFVGSMNASFDNADSAIETEREEIRVAVQNPSLNTEAFQGLIARSAALQETIAGLYVAPVEPTTE